jgi:hypothetical protein
VVKAGAPGTPNVHAGALADRFEALEDVNVFAGIRGWHQFWMESEDI